MSRPAAPANAAGRIQELYLAGGKDEEWVDVTSQVGPLARITQRYRAPGSPAELSGRDRLRIESFERWQR